MSATEKRKKMQTPGEPAKTPKAAGKQKTGPSRADGPVAQARAIFAKLGGKDTAAIREACLKAGINPGTTSVQLGKWRKENGIVVERGPKVKKAPAAKTKAAPAKKEKAPAKPKMDPVANAKPPKKTRAPALDTAKAERNMKAARAAKKAEQDKTPEPQAEERVPGQDDEEKAAA